MLVLFAVILGGIVTGRLLQSRRLAFVSRLIAVIIWALLFLLGLEVGSDPAVVGGMATLGRTAFVIFVFSVAGSIGASWLLWRRIRVRSAFGTEGAGANPASAGSVSGRELGTGGGGLRCELLFRDCCGYIFRNAPESGGAWRVMLARIFGFSGVWLGSAEPSNAVWSRVMLARTFGAGIVLRAVFSPIFFGGVRADARACFSGLRAGKTAVDVGSSERESGDRRLLRRRMRCGTFRSCAVRCRRGACQHVCSLCADVLCRRDAGP